MIMEELKRLGPVGYRSFHLEKICEVNAGHEHNYDHVMFLMVGGIEIEFAYEEDGKTIEGTERFHAPARILVRAKVRHKVKALTPVVDYDCVFSHYDFGGMVTHEFTGNMAAYH